MDAVRAGDSLVVSSPPGTGQTQTAINTIGALVDQGKTVLVVGDRRASLGEISAELDTLGLDSALFQLAGNTTPLQLKGQLVRAIMRNEKSLEPQSATCTPPSPSTGTPFGTTWPRCTMSASAGAARRTRPCSRWPS